MKKTDIEEITPEELLEEIKNNNVEIQDDEIEKGE